MTKLNVNTKRGALGKRGEDAATLYLREKGFIIIERNYECKCGEIDIIAIERDLNLLVFVEVKTRRSVNYGAPSLSIISKKQRHIRNSANVYLIYKRMYLFHNKLINNDTEFRFDVLEVLYIGGKIEIEHIKGAFE